MTVKDIKAFVAEVDPHARHYVGGKPTEDFTVWAERERLPESADNAWIPGWLFEIHRLTRQEDDAIASALDEALNEHPGISYSYEVSANPKTGYIYHHFVCEGY